MGFLAYHPTRHLRDRAWMGSTDLHITRLRKRRDELSALIETAEEQLVHRAGVAFEAGHIDMFDLSNAIEVLAVMRSGKRRERWADAGLPSPEEIRSWVLSQPNCPDGSWWQDGQYCGGGPRPADGQAVVYVLYDANNAPCYVGSSEHFDQRLMVHRGDKNFASWRAWPCADRATAYRRESEMLRDVMPRLNRRR